MVKMDIFLLYLIIIKYNKKFDINIYWYIRLYTLMENIGLFIIINKFTNCFETIYHTTTGTTMDNIKDILISYLAKQFNILDIDFPLELHDFEYIWFKQQHIICNAFNYKIFYKNNWVEPWELEELYTDVLDKMLEENNKNPPNFSELYGEPNPDENKIDNFNETINENPSEYIEEIAENLKEIIKQAKNGNIIIN
jgi:hypothetical protein